MTECQILDNSKCRKRNTYTHLQESELQGARKSIEKWAREYVSRDLLGTSHGEGVGTYLGIEGMKRGVEVTNSVGSHANTLSRHRKVRNIETNLNRSTYQRMLHSVANDTETVERSGELQNASNKAEDGKLT